MQPAGELPPSGEKFVRVVCRRLGARACHASARRRADPAALAFGSLRARWLCAYLSPLLHTIADRVLRVLATRLLLLPAPVGTLFAT